MIVKLLTEHHLEFLSLKGGCRGSSESVTLLKITCHGSLIYCESILVVTSVKQETSVLSKRTISPN